MLKRDEISDPNSCLNRAKYDEYLFVLRSKDLAAPETIREWVLQRLRMKLNKPSDAKILEAWEAADKIEAMQKENKT